MVSEKERGVEKRRDAPLLSLFLHRVATLYFPCHFAELVYQQVLFFKNISVAVTTTRFCLYSKAREITRLKWYRIVITLRHCVGLAELSIGGAFQLLNNVDFIFFIGLS